MASHVASQICRRAARSSLAVQRCGCNAAAGPSAFSQAQSRSRNLQTSAQTWQASTLSQEGGASDSASVRFHGKTDSAAATEARQARVSRPSQARQVSSISTAPSDSLQATQSESTVDAVTEAPSSKLPSFSFARPKQHPITHGNLVCTINLTSYRDDLENLTFFTQFCVHAAYAFGLPCSLPAHLPTKSSLRTVPRSPFVHKPSQENFVKKEHKRQLKVYDADFGAVGQWIDYISENSMSGVRIKATTWESKPVGFGRQMVDDSQQLETSEGQRIKEMAERLLAAGFGQEADKQTNEKEAESVPEAAPASKESVGSTA